MPANPAKKASLKNQLASKSSPAALMRYVDDKTPISLDDLYKNAECAAEMYAEGQTTVGLFIWASTEFAWRFEKGLIGANDHLQVGVPHVGKTRTLLNLSETLENALFGYCEERRRLNSGEAIPQLTHAGTEMRQ